jgi:DNA-binding CsgD family transcriptional regulator
MAELAPTAAPVDRDGDFLERVIDRKEMARLDELVERAARILGDEDTPSELGSDRLGASIKALESWLADRDAAEPADARGAHEQQMERLGERFEARRETLARAEAAVGRLRQITAPATILEVAPQRLCEATRLDRALLSTVDDGAMIVTAAWFEGDPARAAEAVAALADQPIRLEHPLLEAEMIRRRRATVVVDAGLHPRVDPRLTAALGWSSYLAAPVVVRGRVIAVLHGDLRSGQPDVLDREALWRFAVGLAQAYERAMLRRLLRQEREQMRGFLDRLNARIGELSDSAIQLAPWNGRPTGAGGTPRARKPSRHWALGELLTPRETEVLSQMSRGLSNRQIADQLVISQATVKFHINSLLKKLRAENRAEAVSRYLTAAGRAGGEGPD